MTFGKTIARFATVAAFALGAAQAHATVVDVAATSATGTTVHLDAGNYSFSFIGTAQGGAYNAASPWQDVAGCSGAGNNCSQGWLTAIFIDLGNSVGTFDRTTGLAFWPQPYLTPYYSTADAALAAAASGTFIETTLTNTPYHDTTSPFGFSLASAQDVNFYFKDSFYADNRGGVSISLNKMAAVPEPATWAMMLVGFGALGTVMRRRKTQTTSAFA
jgi:hypothetical protein